MQKIPDESVKLLSEFGLTETQARIFITVSRLGSPTVTEVSKISGIRREEIYRSLPGLERSGLIQRIMGHPLRLRVPDMRTAINLLVEQEQSRSKARISELADRATNLLSIIESEDSPEIESTGRNGEFSLVEEKEAVHSLIAAIITRAQDSIDILQSRSNVLWLLSGVGEQLRDAVERGVKLRILTEPPQGRDRLPKIIERRFSRGSTVEFKYMVELKTLFLIADDAEACLVTSNSVRLPKAHLFWTTNENLLSLLREDFQSRWHAAAHWMTVDGVSISEPKKLFVERIPGFGHTMFVYNSEDMKLRFIADRLEQCAEDRFAAVYVCSSSDMDMIVSSLVKMGIDVNKYIEDGLLAFRDFKDNLLHNDGPIAEVVVDFWENLYYERVDMGFNGFLGIIDMDYALEQISIEDVVVFEREIDKVLSTDMEIVCIYPSESLLMAKDPIDLFNVLFHLHDAVVTEKYRTVVSVLDE